MRRLTSLAMAFVLAPLTAAMSGGPAASVEQKGPPVKRTASHYGGAPVGLAPRQGTDISFRARRGDRVTLQVRSAEYKGSPCFGSQTLVDGRGSRTMRVAGYRGSRIFRVRTTGVAVLRFRGVCSSNKGQEPHPVRVQLTKLRLHTVAVDGAVTRVRAARRGFIDVAQLRVSRESRDKLVLRDRDGASAASAQMLVGPWLTPAGTAGGPTVSRSRRDTAWPSVPRRGAPARDCSAAK